MLDNEPTGGERPDSEPAATPVRRTRAKKATSPAAMPEDGQAEAPAPARKRTRKVAVTDISETAGVSGQSTTEGTETPVKATRTRRRKATEPSAGAETFPDLAIPGAEATPAAAQGAAATAGGDEPPARATRTRTSRRAKATAPAEPAGIEPAATGRDQATSTTSGDRATGGDQTRGDLARGDLARGEQERGEPATGARRGQRDAGRAPAEPATTEGPAGETAAERRERIALSAPSVLFMAPDPEEAPPARRSRRGAKAAEPAAAAAAAEPATTTPAPDDATDEPAETSRRSRRRGRRTHEDADAAPAATETPAADDDEDEDDESELASRRRRRGRRGRGRGKGTAEDGDEVDEPTAAEAPADAEDDDGADADGVTRRRRRRRRKGDDDTGADDGVHTVVRIREPRRTSDEVQGVSGSTRLEAKRQRRRDGREQRRTRPPILSESEFLARREAVDRVMVVRQRGDRTQIAVLEDGILVEHYVARASAGTMAGNVYLGKVQNVLPSMEAAFVDVGRGRNAVLYAGEVNWDATGLEGRARSIEQALKSGDAVLVQVTKDPIGHKGARLTSHIALSGRHLVYVPGGNASGISRKLPDNERKRLRDVLKKLVPDGAGVIVRTAAEGASEDELARDVKRLQAQWEDIQDRAEAGGAPALLYEEPDLVIRVVRDLFNEDFREIVVQGDEAYEMVDSYLGHVSPDLMPRLRRHTGTADVFAEKRIDEQILKGLDRKVFLPSGGHLVIDRTEAMTVVDVNTGKYTGQGGNLEETVTRNNLEAAEEIVRQLRLRDLGGIVVIDFIDMVLESNRDLVLRRLTECLGRDRTKHQVTEITSLGLVQMTRKRIGAGLLEAFSETCEVCKGRGLIIHTEPVPLKNNNTGTGAADKVKAVAAAPANGRRTRGRKAAAAEPTPVVEDTDTMGYDLSRYEDAAADGSDVADDADVAAVVDADVEPGSRLASADDPDAAGDEVEAGGSRRRGRRGGARRRTRP
jgi:ribonuclease E